MAHVLIIDPTSEVAIQPGAGVSKVEELELAPRSWLHMTPGTPHSLVATEPTTMLSTLVGS